MKRWIVLLSIFALVWSQTANAAYVPTPTSVIAGGTGLATLTAHGVLVGNGTSSVVLVGPGSTSGVALVSGGSSADPSFTTVLPVGGGTGLATLTAHNVMLGEGTSNVAFAAPGATTGVPLISNNATTDPSFGTAAVAGGGTGATTLAANGVLVGEGTSAVHVVGTSSTADSVVAWAAAGSDPAALAIGSCSAASNALTYSTSSHVFGCNTISAGAAPSVAIAATSASITLASTNLLTTVVNNTTVATATLPSAVTVGTGFRGCIKDGTEDFSAHNVTLKSTAGTIDGIAAATGIVMNITHQELCAISDGTNWYVE